MGETQTEGQYKTLANGAVYDMQKKRIVKGANWDSAKAVQMQEKSVQKKRDLIAAGALAAVEDNSLLSTLGSDAWIYEVGRVQAIKATTPDDPKSTDAARFLLSETGLSEPKQSQSAPIQAQNVYIVQVEEYVARLLTGEREPLDIINVIPDDETPTDAAQGTG